MKLILVKKNLESKGTKSFFWKSEKEIKFLPGQYFYFTLPVLKYYDPKGPTREFTISCSPTEEKLLAFTTRVRENSGFKKTLDSFKIGSFIEAEGPTGTFILDEHETGNHLFIAGGIGITPFRCFIKYNIDKHLVKNHLYLIYSNSVPEEIAFRREFEDWTKKYPNIKDAMTITKPEESKEKWTELTGRVNEIMIKKLIEKWNIEIGNINFWLCGPPPMVSTMEMLLKQLKISSNKIRVERFTGY